MIEVAQAEVGYAESVFSFADGMQEGEVKVRDGAMALVSAGACSLAAITGFTTAVEGYVILFSTGAGGATSAFSAAGADSDFLFSVFVCSCLSSIIIPSISNSFLILSANL